MIIDFNAAEDRLDFSGTGYDREDMHSFNRSAAANPGGAPYTIIEMIGYPFLAFAFRVLSTISKKLPLSFRACCVSLGLLGADTPCAS